MSALPDTLDRDSGIGVSPAKTTVILEKYDADGVRYNSLMLNNGLRFEAIEEWESDVKIDALDDAIGNLVLLFSLVSTSQSKIYVDNPDAPSICVNIIHHGSSSYTVKVAALDSSSIKSIMTDIHAILVPLKPALDGKINVRFWWNTSNGPASTRRTIVAPKWDEISGNYEETTAKSLDRLMDGFKPSFGGQIIIWHGKPGTGKTFALRALCASWKKWCSIEYIIDPENLFGPNAGYLVQTLLGQQDTPVYDDDDDDEVEIVTPKKGWKLLILEDTGELVREDAKEQTGQGLSRLLNVADGFIGQGLKVLVLITTNEVVEKLHPAVKRPGRAASVIEFNPLPSNVKKRWAEKHGLNLTSIPQSGILADMYGSVEGFATETDAPKKIGFGVSREL